MGLDCSHDAWHGSYSAFMRWRKEIARLINVPLEFMEGFYSPDPDSTGGMSGLIRLVAHTEKRLYEVQNHSQPAPDDTYAAAMRRAFAPFPLKWETLRPDPLHALLNHSDCGGTLEPSDCAAIADRLEQLLPLLPKEDDGGHIGNWRQKTQQFIDGCREAAAAGEPLRFE